MFYSASRFAANLVDPSTIILLVYISALVLAWRGHLRASAVVFVSAAGLIFGTMLLSSTVLRPLESRFPIWHNDDARPISGIVVLGGALDAELAAFPGSGFHKASGRLIATALLARHFGEARVLYSGGNESEQGKTLLVSLGIAPDRVIIENTSRSTAENAALSLEVVHPRPGERWLLVTSAFHMPRAIGAFRAAGFPVEPYPVDFRMKPAQMLVDLPTALEMVRIGLKEYLGLLAYWLSGRTAVLFPPP
jgi:uncharacterized SAM-binding protein YcdF (DUF218 family)